jgi:hypothetical protein
MDGAGDRWLRERRYAARYLASSSPALYLSWARRHYRGTGVVVVDDDTELVIEAFGRSGSTFAVDAFERVQRRPVAIAHHTHAAAAVLDGVRRGLPTLVLVKDPVAATLSHMDRRKIGAEQPLRAWVRYHERILPHREGFVVGATKDLSTGIGDMIEEVNARFGTSYDVFDPTPESVAAVFEGIEARNRQRYGEQTEFVARPSPDREARKETGRREAEGPRLAALRDRAYVLYHRLLQEHTQERSA